MVRLPLVGFIAVAVGIFAGSVALYLPYPNDSAGAFLAGVVGILTVVVAWLCLALRNRDVRLARIEQIVLEAGTERTNDVPAER